MTRIVLPRQDVIWLGIDEPLETLWREASDGRHARFVVARGELEPALAQRAAWTNS